MTTVVPFAAQNRFYDRAYEEGIGLVVEARNYMAYQEKRERSAGDLTFSLYIGYQQTRVTARLLHAMAWLMGQKAVAMGELTIEQFAAPHWALGGGIECRDASGPEDERLPKGLRDLLDRTHQFYHRVVRLEQQMKGGLKKKKAAERPVFTGLRVVGSAEPVAVA